MPDENIRKSFEKIREDMLFLSQELLSIREEIQELRQILHSNTYPTHDQHPTHNPTHNFSIYDLNPSNFHSSIGNEGVPTNRQQTDNRQSNTLKRTSEIASILGNLKQDLREKFRKLTKQEFLIFSVLYTLEEELKNVTYKDIAQRTGLAESSVRDYILKIEHKGLPISRERINNKIVLLKIPREFKEMTTLNSLNELNSN